MEAIPEVNAARWRLAVAKRKMALAAKRLASAAKEVEDAASYLNETVKRHDGIDLGVSTEDDGGESERKRRRVVSSVHDEKKDDNSNSDRSASQVDDNSGKKQRQMSILSVGDKSDDHIRAEQYNQIVFKSAESSVSNDVALCTKPEAVEILSLPLPKPADKYLKQYTKSEAVEILSRTVKGSTIRINTMLAMVDSGYVPTSIRTLQRLIKLKEDGKPIVDSAWSYHTSGKKKKHTTEPLRKCEGFEQIATELCRKCEGIQSSTLEQFATENLNLKYCSDAGWFRNTNGHWHSNGCSNDGDTDSNNRCNKCRHAYSKIKCSRHPKMFSDLPSLDLTMHADVSALVSKRLETIADSDIPTDPVLKKAAGMLRLSNQCDRVDIGNSKVFIVCSACPGHRVCRKQANVIGLCQTCNKKQASRKDYEKRREKENSALGVLPESLAQPDAQGMLYL